MRPIDADALKKEIDEWLDTVGEATIAKNRAYYGELIGCIKDMPTVERPGGEWISVEERLPKRRMECLCLYQFGSDPRYRYYGVLFFNPEEYADNGYVKGPHFNNEGMDDLKVVYWMPLPEKPKIDMRGEEE